MKYSYLIHNRTMIENFGGENVILNRRSIKLRRYQDYNVDGCSHILNDMAYRLNIRCDVIYSTKSRAILDKEFEETFGK